MDENEPPKKFKKIEGEGENVNVRSLSELCRDDDIEEVKKSLQSGADPNQFCFRTCQVPLNVTSHIGIQRLLIDNGADVHKGRGFNIPPISFCSWIGDPGILRLYLENGANPNFVDSLGCDLFMYLIEGLTIYSKKYRVRGAYFGECYNEQQLIARMKDFYLCAETLLEFGADLNPKMKPREELASTSLIFQALEKKCYVFTDWLIDHGADPNAIVNKVCQDSILTHYTKLGNPECVEILLKPRFQEQIMLCCLAREHDETSDFHGDFLCRDMFYEIMKVVTQDRTNPHLKDIHGRTALDWALDMEDQLNSDVWPRIVSQLEKSMGQKK